MKTALVLLGILWLVAVPAFLVQVWIDRRIKTSYPDLRRQFGSPNWLSGNTIDSNIRVLKFIYSGEVARLQDSTLYRLILVKRFIDGLMLLLLIGYVVSLFR